MSAARKDFRRMRDFAWLCEDALKRADYWGGLGDRERYERYMAQAADWSRLAFRLSGRHAAQVGAL